MLGQVIEKNKMLKAHILATGLPISSKLCGIAMCPLGMIQKSLPIIHVEALIDSSSGDESANS